MPRETTTYDDDAELTESVGHNDRGLFSEAELLPARTLLSEDQAASSNSIGIQRITFAG